MSVSPLGEGIKRLERVSEETSWAGRWVKTGRRSRGGRPRREDDKDEMGRRKDVEGTRCHGPSRDRDSGRAAKRGNGIQWTKKRRGGWGEENERRESQDRRQTGGQTGGEKQKLEPKQEEALDRQRPVGQAGPGDGRSRTAEADLRRRRVAVRLQRDANCSGASLPRQTT